MTSRTLALACTLLPAALFACAPGDATGDWTGDLNLTDSTGSPPSTIGGSYSVTAAVEAKPSGDCGVTVDVTNAGTWVIDDGVACAGGGFDATAGAEQNTELGNDDVEGVHLTGTSANQLTLVLSGTGPDWTCTFGGAASRTP